jgi:ribosome-associated heat shock protein Hsp15
LNTTAPSIAAASLSAPERAKARLDQWLWFARFVKTRSLGARLCAAGAVAVNGTPVKKPNQTIRVGDVVVLPQGNWQLTVRVLAFGARRGPATEARGLYEEAAAAARLRDLGPPWAPLLADDEPAETHRSLETRQSGA